MRLEPDPGVLSGILVLDLGQAAVGPIAASYLGMMGATVIKVEQPSGDMVRTGKPNMQGTSSTFVGNNLTKYGIVLDLKTPEGHEAIKRLIAKADLLIENFRSPEIMERLGLGYDKVLSRLNPRLIYMQSSAFGAAGPWTGMFSDEWMAECVSGFVSMTGAAGERGEFTRGSALLDWNGAMVNTVACLAGLVQRDRTGVGMMIRTSQFGSSIFASLTRLAELVASGNIQGPLGSAAAYVVPDQAFRAADGYVNVSVPAEKFWPRLCEVIGRRDLAADSRFVTNALRVENRAKLVEILAEILATRTCADWLGRLDAADVPCGSNPSRESLTGPQLRDAQVAANGMLIRIDSAYGSILTHAPHWEFEKTPAAIRRPSPLLSEHTEMVLRSIDGWTPRRVPAATGDTKQDGSIEGMRVIEFAEGIPGPLCGMVLAQLGADVLRVESPGGDWLRDIPPLGEGVGAVYRVLNTGKRSRTADLTSERGRAELHEAIASADVIVVGFRPQKLNKLGLAYEQIRALNPSALYCHISGWGRRGARATAAATELSVQAIAGMHRYLGTNGVEPVRLGFDLASTAAGLAAVQGILAGLLWRHATGDGQRIDVSMLAAGIAINQWSTAAESCPDEPVGRQLEGHAWPRDYGFASRDGRCLIGFRQEALWRRFAVAIGRVDLLDDPEFVRAVGMHPPLFAPLVENTLRGWTMTALDRLVRGELGGTLVPVLDLGRMLDHEQTKCLGVIDRSHGLHVRFPLSASASLVREDVHA